jgi:hypothetical protein
MLFTIDYLCVLFLGDVVKRQPRPMIRNREKAGDVNGTKTSINLPLNCQRVFRQYGSPDDAASCPECVSRNYCIINEYWIGICKETGFAQFKELSQHSSGGTEETHENPQSGKPVSGQRFEPGPFRGEVTATWPRHLEGSHSITVLVCRDWGKQLKLRWLSSSGRWRRVALIRTDVSEDRIASIFRVHECELVTERSCYLLYRHKLVGLIVTAVETSNLTTKAYVKCSCPPTEIWNRGLLNMKPERHLLGRSQQLNLY